MYVYGLIAADRDVVAHGIGDAPVSTLHHGELAAIVSRVERAPLRPKRRDLLRHSDVLQTAFSEGPVVPLRFGTVFDSEAAVVDDLLGGRYEELVGLLQRVDGLVELRLRAVFLEQELLAEVVRQDERVASLRRAPESSPLELGEAVANAVSTRRHAAADEALASLLRHALEVEVDEPRDGLEVLRASFLVEREHLEAFERAGEEFAKRHAGRIAVNLIGPMPPHSFVSLDSARGR